MAEELKIKEQKQIVARGFVQYSQEVVELAKKGFVLDVRNKTSPQFQLGLFICNMLLLEEDIFVSTNEIGVVEDATNVAEKAAQPKQKRTYAKSDKAKAALAAKLPAEALQTITG